MNDTQYWDDLLIKQKKANGRKAELMRCYRMSLEYFESMVHLQNGLCAICKRPPTKKTETKSDDVFLSVDMDSTTKNIRGLLCRRCKSAVSYLNESPAIAAALVAHLSKSKPLDN